MVRWRRNRFLRAACVAGLLLVAAQLPTAAASAASAAPVVTAVSPASGPASGGTQVTVTGSGFTVATSVYFGGTPAQGFSVESDTQIVALSPPGNSAVDVTVVSPGGVSAASAADRFTYQGTYGYFQSPFPFTTAAAPIVTAVSPAGGPPAGGTEVTVTGSGFTGGATVDFGSNPANGVTVTSEGGLTAVSPPGGGTVDVTVSTPGGVSVTNAADRFTYLTTPIGTAVSPSSGPASGGTQVTVSGIGFTSGAIVDFGANPARSVAVTSDTSLTALSPPGNGTVDVSVSAPGGVGAASIAGQFTYFSSGGLTSSGGTLFTPDGTFTMIVPPTAVPAGATMSVSESNTTPAGLPTGMTAASPVFTLTGASLGQPQTAVIAYHAAVLAGLSPRRLAVYEQESGNAWTALPSTVAAESGTISAYVRGSGSLIVLANTRRFTDLPAGYWARPAIDRLLGADVATGFPDGTFRPDAALTRAQFVAMLVRTLALPPSSGGATFTDVPADAWYAADVSAAVQAGVVQGLSPSTFGPNGTLTREQMAEMLARALKLTRTTTLAFKDSAQIDAWATVGVEQAVAAGYIRGFPNGTFQPLATATRAQAAKVMAMVLARQAPGGGGAPAGQTVATSGGSSGS